MVFKELLAAFSRHLRFERTLSPATVASYSYAARAYLLYLEGKGLKPSTVTTNDITAYLGMKAEFGLKPVSIFSIGIALRSLYGFLMLHGCATSNPAQVLKLPRFRSRLPDPLTEEEVAKLLSFPAVRFVQIRDLAVLELLYCGLRLSEALQLQEGQIHFQEGYLRVWGKGNRERLVPAGRRALTALERYLEEKIKRFGDTTGPVFLTRHGRGLSRASFWRRVKLYARWAGIRKPVYPHLLRHCFASHLIGRGADLKSIQQMLGHAHLSTTAIYLHLHPQQVIDVYQRSHPRA